MAKRALTAREEEKQEIARETEKMIRKWQKLVNKDPVEAAFYFFKIEMWSKQADFFRSIFDNKQTVCRSGHGIGKTQSVQMAPPLWLLKYYPDAIALVTAASWDNVRTVIFPNMAAMIANSVMGEHFKQPTSTAWRPLGTGLRWGAFGLSPTKPERLAGYHSGATLLLIDEASQLEYAMGDAATSLLTGANDHYALTGNPLRGDGFFIDACENRSGLWTVHHISSLESPNVVEGKEVIPGLCTKQWVEDRKREYGEDSLRYKTRVLGEIPDTSEDTFFPISLIKSTENREITPNAKRGKRVMGIDPATSPTGDATAFVVRNDVEVLWVEEKTGWAEQQIASRAVELQRKWAVEQIKIDIIGPGNGVANLLTERGVAGVTRVHSSSKAHDVIQFANTRAEMYGRLRDAMHTLSIPTKHMHVLEDLHQLKYKPNGKGQYQFEQKKDFRARVGHSPDKPDALALTYARFAGESVFDCFDADVHVMTVRPFVVPGERAEFGRRWVLERDGYPHGSGIDGCLARAWWYSWKGEKAVAWIHIDIDGDWTVFKYLSAGPQIKLASFVEQVWRESQELYFGEMAEHNYEHDYCCADQGPVRDGDSSFAHVIDEVLSNLGSYNTPETVDFNRISKSQGFPEVENMLLATLAHYPNHPYWAGQEKLRLESTGAGLYVWPQEAAAEISLARMKPDLWGRDEMEDKAENAYGGGGPLIRCLRLLCVVGAAYAPQWDAETSYQEVAGWRT